MPGRPSITSHVLDTERGEPAPGVPIVLLRHDGESFATVATVETNEDGRTADMEDGTLRIGAYRIVFDLAEYFRRQGREAVFFTRVEIDFEVADVGRHYHVPLLLSRYSCASYRGS